MWVAGFGEAGQRRLKNAAVLVSRIGGVGGNVALQLAAAGIGKLVLAHAGTLRRDDLNRQILMSHAHLGSARVEQAAWRLRELNPRLEVESIDANISAGNVARLRHELVLARRIDRRVDPGPKLSGLQHRVKRSPGRLTIPD